MALTLPPPEALERICHGLATLDAALCEDWEDRFFSFNSKWNVKARQRMASMRNGEGDEWFLLFAAGGVFLKGFGPDYRRVPARTVYAGLPKALAPQLKEPAFSMQDVSFGGYFDGTWTLRGDPKALRDALEILQGEPASYRAFAADVFGAKVPLDAVKHVLQGGKLDAAVLKKLKSERTLAEMKEDLQEIGRP